MELESKPVVSKLVELPLKKGLIRIEVGETSHGRDQLVISIDQEAQTQSALSREEGVNMFKEIKDPTYTTPKIQKVIFLLRDHTDFVKYYEPRVVSLGPIHHGKEKYRLAETFKLLLAKKFVDDSGKTMDDLLKAVDGNIKELRESFEKEVTEKYNDGELAWILFVDGCAILGYIFIAVENKFKELNIKQDSVAFCQQDLFLLENQVPYYLLELLMSQSQSQRQLKNSIDEFIKRNHHNIIMDEHETGPNGSPASAIPQSGIPPESKKGKPTHLLDLLRSSLLGSLKPTVAPTKASNHSEPTTQTAATVASNQSEPTTRTAATVDSNHSEPTTQTAATVASNHSVLATPSYRNVQELKAAGIHVKRREVNSARGISVKKNFNFLRNGFLWLLLPPLIVDDATAPKFLNLIAYEMCLDFKNDFGITSYVSFLDSLIDEANDVKELRKARVLINLLGSDEEVARLFNEIGTDLVPDLNEYEIVKSQIQKYYDKTWVTWMAEFGHNHFSSPWTIIAFVGVLLALALTFTQTWYAAHPPPSPCDRFCEKFNQNLRKG